MPKKTDRDIVIHYKGEYFMVKEATWRTGTVPKDGSLGRKLAKVAADPAQGVVDSGGIVGYVADKKKKTAEGGYSTVLNLDAILKGAPRK